jgi:tricorn protease
MRGFYLFPDVYGERVIFVTDDDLWEVPVSGGKASRLTSDFGIVLRPKFSPDGRWIAFTRLQVDDQNVAEVYVIPSEGGEPKRLTYFGSPTTSVAGWTPDGRVVVSSDYQTPFRRWTDLFAVDPVNGAIERLPLGPATSIAYGKRAVVIGRNTQELPHWKRYRGGTRGKFWIDYYRGEFSPFLDLPGHLTSPMWVGERFFFLSDHEGIGNLYSVSIEGGDLRRHTNFTEYYVRNGNTDGEKVVFSSAGEIFLYTPDGELRRIEIEASITGKQRAPRFVEIWRNLNEYTLSPGGETLGLTIRGKPFFMRPWDGPVIQLGERNGVRYKHVRFLSPDRVALVSDASGEERVEIWGLRGGLRDVVEVDFGLIEFLEPSPKGDLIAVSNNRFELWIVDVKSKVAKLLDRSEFGVIEDVAWHPGGEWLAYSYPANLYASNIRIANVSSGLKFDVTTPNSVDFSPSFDPEGRYLFYLSKRSLDPIFDQVFFDMGFQNVTKPFYASLNRSAPSLFNKPLFQGEAKAEVEPQGVQGRVEPFPVEPANYVKLRTVKGKVILLSFPVRGASRSWLWSGGRPSGVLEVFDLETGIKEQLLQNVEDFQVSGDWILVKSGNQLRAFQVDKKPDMGVQEPGRKSGLVDVSRVKVYVEPEKEWRQMLRETWRLMRENFWREDLNGLDWEEMLNRYLRLLDRVNTRYELSEVIREMQGETGTSHAYEIGGDYQVDRPYPVGGLGVELKFVDNCYRVNRFFEGDPSNEGERSPLRAPGADVQEGDCIEAIDGVQLSAGVTPQSLLMNRAGDLITVRVRKPDGRVMEFAVKTLRNEKYLVYRDWVERNRRYVHEVTKGRVGYVHIPDMGPMGFAEFHRLYTTEVYHDGLIIDVRYNGGGNVSHLLLEKLTRKRIGVDKPRRGKPVPYPPFSPTSAMVLVTNEHAGSDGDIFTHSFKLLGLGPVVGTRTWGGVVGIAPRHRLVDGTYVTQPQFAFWFKDVGWGVENYGTDPTVPVDVSPQDYGRGRDPQLEKAVEIVMSMLDRVEDPLKVVESLIKGEDGRKV